MRWNIKRGALAVAAALLMVTAPSTLAQEPSAPGTVSRVVDTLNPTNWTMPKFFKMPKFSGILPTKQEKTTIRKKKDGLVSEVTQTASRSWARTKESLSPKNLNPIRFMPASSRKPAAAPKTKEPGFFGSLFSPEPPPRRNDTVTDFLGQDKPRG